MFVLYPGPDARFITIADVQTGKTETVPVKKPTSRQRATIQPAAMQPSWIFNAFAA